MKNKKAGAFSIIIWMTAVVIIIFFLAGWLYMHNILTNILVSLPSTPQVNISYAVQGTIVPLNNAMSSLHYISFILIFMLAFGILIENFYIRKHPVLFMVHILIVIIAIIGAIYISNDYESLLNSSMILSPTLQGFSASNNIALYLPYWVAIIGIFGLILLVINAVRDPEIRGGGI